MPGPGTCPGLTCGAQSGVPPGVLSRPGLCPGRGRPGSRVRCLWVFAWRRRHSVLSLAEMQAGSRIRSSVVPGLRSKKIVFLLDPGYLDFEVAHSLPEMAYG